MDTSLHILLDLFIVFTCSLIGGEISQRLKFPAVVGEIVAGIVIGPSVLGWISLSDHLHALSELGAVLLLFSVGLETQLRSLKEVGGKAALVAIAGVTFPFMVGYAFGQSNGYSFAQSMFLSAAFVATSAGITARVLQELGVLETRDSRIILGAALIDDILGMLVLGVVTAVTSTSSGGSGLSFVKIGLVVLQALGFVGVTLWAGHHVIKRRPALLDAPLHPLSPLTISLSLCLALACLSSTLGLAGIIGAFLAGTIASEASQKETLHQNIEPLLAFIVPFFFVMTGAMVDISSMTTMSNLLTVGWLTLLAFLSKAIACGAMVAPLGLRSALFVGIGMVPRGEVGIIIASLGLTAGILTEHMYSLMIVMCLTTSLIAPPFLRLLLAKENLTTSNA